MCKDVSLQTKSDALSFTQMHIAPSVILKKAKTAGKTLLRQYQFDSLTCDEEGLEEDLMKASHLGLGVSKSLTLCLLLAVDLWVFFPPVAGSSSFDEG